jgi:hypothetical protein
MDPAQPHPRINLDRLLRPVPWRPALQIGDSFYPISKVQLRSMVKAARRPSR